MIREEREFTRLVREAWEQEFRGWDFAFVHGRIVEAQPSWDYRALAKARMRASNAMLDLDTGGGEFLAGLQPFSPIAYATEGFASNIPVAKAALELLGVKVHATSADKRLPFPDGMFDLVINRHGDLWAEETYRVLKPGGLYLTQQVGGKNNIRLNELLQDQVDFCYSEECLQKARDQLQAAGFSIVVGKEEFPPVEFRDIGAVVFYLKVISWQIADFSAEKYLEKLGEIHNGMVETGKLDSIGHRFFIEAVKPQV